MKKLVTLLFLFAFAFTGLSAQRDTLTVSQSSTSGKITIKSQRSGSLSINPFEYNGFGNIEAVYSTANADTMIILRNTLTQTVVARYRKTQFYFSFRQLGITAATAFWLNTTYFNPKNLAQLNVTTAVRDSLLLWGTVPVGTIIFNTSIDSAQIRVNNTINWITL
jgi:hypothetical protein